MRLFVAVFPPPEVLDHLAATVAQLNLTRRIIPPERWHITLAFLGDVPLAFPPAPVTSAAAAEGGAAETAATSAAVEGGEAENAAAVEGGETENAATPSAAAVKGGAAGNVATPSAAAAEGGAAETVATSAAAAGNQSAAHAGGAARDEGAKVRDVAAEVVWGALGRVRVPVGQVSVASGGRFGQVVWAGVSGDGDGLTRLSRAVRRELRAVRVRSDDKQFRPHLTIARSAEGLSVEDMAKLKAYQGPSWPVSDFVLVRSELGPHPEYSRLGAWPVSSAPG